MIDPVTTREQRVLAEQVRGLYRSIPATTVAALLGTPVFATLFWSSVDHRVVLVWAVANIVVFGVPSLWIYFRFEANNSLPLDGAYWLRLFIVRNVFCAMASGSFGAAFFLDDSLSNQVIIFAVLVALMTSMVPEVAQHQWAYTTTLSVIMAPFVARAVWQWTYPATWMGILAFVVFIYTLLTARSLNRNLVRMLDTRFSNEELIEQLHAQKTIAEQALEAARLAIQRAEAANQQKSRFLASASHDLRQPMHALSLFVAAAQRAHEDEHKQLLNRIESSVNAMAELFDALLDISRFDAGVMVPDVREVELEPILKRLALEYRESAEENGLRLSERVIPARVRTDAALLERVIRNYLGNAIRYTRKGGVLLACRRHQGNMRVEVWDSGPGIPNEHLSQIYEEFFQVDNKGRDRSKGLGLGLSIVKRISELLHHEIEVASKPGRGSRFSILVPLSEGSNGVLCAHDSVDNAAALVGALVVVIDDEADVRDAMQVLLKQWGCRVLVAEGVAGAMAGLTQHERGPDVVISDYLLREGATGIEAIRTVQRSYPNVSAILVTGDTSPDRLREVSASGCALLHKPLSADQLRQTLVRAVHRSMSIG